MTGPPAVTIVDVAWRRVIAYRPAVIALVTTGRGMIGAGEAAPLPGRSTDDVEQAAAALAGLAARVPFTIGADPVRGAAELAAAVTTAPAARFAIETALLDAAARERGLTVAELLAATPAMAVPVNAVVDDVGGARRAIARGITTIKVKLAGTDDPRSTLAAIRAAIGPTIALRVDVNRGWPTATALAHLHELAGLGLEYVEEPCRGTGSIAADSPVPLALDETVADVTDAALEPMLAGIAVLVLKPTLVGGLGRALAVAQRAARRRVDVVVTHALEGPIATAACAELARALRCRRAVGLDAHPGLAPWRHTRVPQLGAAAVIGAAGPGLGLDHHALLADLAELS